MATKKRNGNGWEVNKRWVEDRFDNHEQRIGKLEDRGLTNAVEMGRLGVKASLWGGLPGVVLVLLYLLYRLLTMHPLQP